MRSPVSLTRIERRPEYAMVERVEIHGQEIKPQTRRTRIAGRDRRPLGDGGPGEDRRRALSEGGAVRGAARTWQRRFGDGGQSRLVGIWKVGRISAGPPVQRANDAEEARLYLSCRADARTGDRREHGDFQFD